MKKYIQLLICISVGLFSFTSCQTVENALDWTAASLCSDEGYFVIPGSRPRASQQETEQALGYILEPRPGTGRKTQLGMNWLMLDPVQENGQPGLIALYNHFSEIELSFDDDELLMAEMYFEGNDASETSQKFYEEAVSLWGEPEIENADRSLALNGKSEPVVMQTWKWQKEDELYRSICLAGTVSREDEVLRFYLQWGNYRMEDIKIG